MSKKLQLFERPFALSGHYMRVKKEEISNYVYCIYHNKTNIAHYLYFILNNLSVKIRYCFSMLFSINKQVWTQKCAVEKASVDVNISYY
jgi:hypothetical protein